MARTKRKRAPDTETFTGRVIEIDAGGYGPNSAQLLFGLNSMDGLTNMAFVALSDTEPQVFSSMAAMLTMAYRAAIPVTVTYVTVDGQTPRAAGLRIPAAD